MFVIIVYKGGFVLRKNFRSLNKEKLMFDTIARMIIIINRHAELFEYFRED